MSCNSCAKSFSLLRKEKGCPGCGFSYCSKCLDNKTYLPKLHSEARVCAKCKQSVMTREQKQVEPPDAYYKRVGAIEHSNSSQTNAINVTTENTKDQEILERLQKLKEDSKSKYKANTDEEIAKRLQNIKGELPTTSDAELYSRLARLKGIPNVGQSKPVLPLPDVRSEQEQADDLLKQYIQQTKIDTNYKDEFDNLVNDIETRMQKLKGSTEPARTPTTTAAYVDIESEDEEEVIKKIIEKAKTEYEDSEIPPPTYDELPFCEICNEDAKMRCLGCRYLFCKRCFLEHKDDDECNKYEPYSPKDK